MRIRSRSTPRTVALFFGLVPLACGAATADFSDGDGFDTSQTSGAGGAAPQANQPCAGKGSCGASGACKSAADCPSGSVCTGGTCAPGTKCGSQEITGEPLNPNLLIVLDRSCSMRNELIGTVTAKWTMAVQAVNKVTQDYADKIRFGLILFPDKDEDGCAQKEVAVKLGADKVGTIDDLLTAALDPTDDNYPNGPCDTNIDTAIELASQQNALEDPEHPGNILLITDGKQTDNCYEAGSVAGTVQTIQSLHTNAHVSTFVVGFGTKIDADALNQLAEAGGSQQSNGSGTAFYQAEDAASLDAALASIATKALGCTFVLDSKPPNPGEIYVFFNNDPSGIPRDQTHKTGWDYEAAANRVTFYGASCDLLEAGKVSDVDIVFGCPAPTPN